MDDLALLRMVLSRPEVNAGARTGTAVLAFLIGYSRGRAESNNPVSSWDNIFEQVRLSLSQSLALAPENALAVSQLLERRSGGDDAKAFEVLAAEIENALRAGASPAR